MTVTKERYRWLRDALADKGLRAKDVAKAWGCTDAVVSRFIKLGEPELTWDRAETLSRMLGMDLRELQIRFAEKPLPDAIRHSVPSQARPNHRDHEHEQGHVPVGAQAALERLREAVNYARQVLPGYRITVKIELDGEEQ
jgi:hypothetical protein